MSHSLVVPRELAALARAEIDLILEALVSPPQPAPWKTTPATFAQQLSGGRWHAAPHLELLSEALAAIEAEPSGRLIVEMPPRHGKSFLVSQWFPTWYLDRHPERRIMLASYEAGFAASWGRRVRNLVAEHAALLRVRIADDSSAADRWDTTEGGGMVTLGVGGPATGKGADVLVIDDPTKNAAEAHSQVYRDNLWEWFQSTAYTRLEPGASAVVLQTRWHEDDLVGRLLEQMSKGGDRWTVIRLPALAEGDDPLGRAEGAALWPARYDEMALESIRSSVSDWVWDALYQQRPSAPGGSIFRRDWWADGLNRFDLADRAIVNRSVGRYLSFDTAFKETESSAFTACVVGELWPDYRMGIREVWRERLSFPDLVPAIEATARRHNADGKLRGVIIEDRASGTSAYQTLAASAPDWLRGLLVAFQPSGSKAERAKQASVWTRNGCVLLPFPSEQAPWLYEFEQEIYAAPFGQWLDQTDALSQLVIYTEHLLAEGWRARGMAA